MILIRKKLRILKLYRIQILPLFSRMARLEPLSPQQQHGALAIELQYATVLCTVHTYPKNVIGTLAHIIRLLKLGAFINLLI